MLPEILLHEMFGMPMKVLDLICSQKDGGHYLPYRIKNYMFFEVFYI